MPWIVGNDFSALQAGENAADSNRRLALASAMNAATSGLQFGTEQARRQQVMEFEQKQAALAQQNKEAELALQKTKADQELKHWNDQAELGRGYLAEAKRQGDRMDKEGTIQGNRERQAEFARAYSEADSGAKGLPPGQAPEDYFAGQGFSPGQVKTLVSTAMSRWQQEQDAYDKANDIADTLNNYDLLNAKVAAADAKVKALSGHMWNSAGYSAAKEDLDHLTASRDQMSQFVPRLQKAVQDPKHPLSSVISPPTSPGDSWNVTVHPPKRNPYAWQPGEADYVYGEGPVGATDRSADTGGEMGPDLTPTPLRPVTRVPIDATGVGHFGNAQAQAPAAAAATAPRYHPAVYTRAYQLMGQNVDPKTAMTTALQEFQQAQAQGSIP